MTAPAPLVVKIGGAAVDEPRETMALWRAIADAHAALEGSLLLVHGGGKAVDRHLDRLGFTTERLDGLRVTPPDQMGEIAAVLAGRVNKTLVGALNATGVKAVGLCLGDGGAILCERHPEPRLGRVGLVSGGDGAFLRVLMKDGFLPVLCSIGLDADGGFLNVNADDAAAGVAQVLQARALVLLTDVDGIKSKSGALVPAINHAGIERMIESGEITGGMIPKARAAAAASARAAAPAYIASFNRPADLSRIIRGEPAGTRVEG